MLEEKIENLIKEPLLKENIKLIRVNYLNENGTFFLRITIDKEPFVDIDTCVKATDIINPIIDKIENEFNHAYILDVCSNEGDE